MDKRDTLANKLKESKFLTKEEIERACQFFEVEELDKNRYYLEAGKRCSRIGFLESGILCTFVYSQAGEEVVKYFVEDHQFFTDMESYENATPALLNIMAIVNSRVWSITKWQNAQLHSEIPNWKHALNFFAAQALNRMIQNQHFLKLGEAADQYKHFLKNHPNLARQVPLKYIASYLGITQSSLSRLRREVQ